ncbi:S8 family serine peptidase [Providencia burhodogranariea]|uniref:Subtilisin family serine protease-like protein n=1 Tax=Providencia burhodogranariea DSM 19968 TaxID=1141662 RepID=K8X093_9GAMM|nr:S8 family serine peptidase [Providencia burhodogranariea]EKT61865.1 subtilisin family serine protease-like protein [Providencia burhodogranariea DSM 19968]
MEINVFKFINNNENGIVVNFNNPLKKEIKIDLVSGNKTIESILTEEENHLFQIEKTGIYNIELSFKDNNGFLKKTNSNEILFTKKNKTPRNETYRNYVDIYSCSTEKSLNSKIDGIDKYYLEIKIKTKHSTKLNEKIKSDINLKLKLTPLSLNSNKNNEKNKLSDYQYLKYDGNTNFEDLNSLARMIDKLDYIEYCCVSPNTNGYSPLNTLLNTRNNNHYYINNFEYNDTTPDFSLLQTYLNEPSGMNIRNAWNKNIDASNVVVRHLDFGIYRNHEDLKDSNITVINSRPESEDCNHGTASTGCIVGSRNNFGVTGIAYGCKYYFYDTGDLDLIVNDTQAGDIISLDIQFLIDDKLLPVTTSRSWWERIKILIDKGATVIIAAGNGALDLSIPGVMNNFGDNGSMLIGACHHDTGTRVSFSNYNQETSLLNSWGDWSVTTTGYGSLQQFPGNNRNYTNTFSGTSSATPLCSGALALLQDYAKRNNVILSAWEMRKIIKLSNYTEGVKDGIGYRPNVDYLFKKIDELILNEIPYTCSENHIDSALIIPLVFNKEKNSKFEFSFDYSDAQVEHVGFVCVHQEQGENELIWYKHDYSLIKVLVVNIHEEKQVIYLRMSKVNDDNLFSMNSASMYNSSNENKFKLVFEYLKEDNPYIDSGRHVGTLPLYAKSWEYSNYKLNIMVNIIIL